MTTSPQEPPAEHPQETPPDAARQEPEIAPAEAAPLEESNAPLEPTEAPEPAEPVAEADAAANAAPAAVEENAPAADAFPLVDTAAAEERRRKRLLAALVLVLLALCGVGGLFVRYLRRPQPLPELLPVAVEVNYPPHYLFAIYDVDGPLGVALSPMGGRLYVTEGGGDRLVKIFDTQGSLLGSFAPPRTTAAQRSPVYIATDVQGRVFVTDRLQHAIFVYDRDGHYLDTILSPSLTLSEYIAKHTGSPPARGTFAYNIFEEEVYYQDEEGTEQTLPRPDRAAWAPLGVAFDPAGRMIVTDVARDNHRVLVFPMETIARADWTDFAPQVFQFGSFGEADDQFQFPNKALVDAQGRFVVSDGNNGRLSVWNADGQLLSLLGSGGGEGGLNLPRGMAFDDRQRLHVVDAVGQVVRVYDFAKEQPAFLYAFGAMGTLEGQFNYPNDIAIDAHGRLYIADRANNRVQVWSY
ncbi:MAG TPA: hypothetical protein ENJ54_03375 [Chloroflexi bacterium]|nr:hypothetical protein [Chloroflexota bacterium]